MWFLNKSPKCPITEEDKLFVDQSFSWVLSTFGNDVLENEVILPKGESFCFKITGTETDVDPIFTSLCSIMGVPKEKICIKYYNERKQIDFGGGLSSQYSENVELTAGKYVQFESGDVEILLEEEQYKNPIALIATLAHELAHYKLLYEQRIDENNEFVTDLLTIVYGLGVFGANTSIVEMQSWNDGGFSGWQVKGGAGYLHFKVWAYALAYYALLKGDDYRHWADYLEKDVRSIFNKCIKYLECNEFKKE
ncbi:hypothetical protein [Reichenbachiella sp.]|uniref:hypothetical protein n=1 Tax=Reichenbachiella sp. TaxID=2184521 RepID=UPI003B5BC0EA